MLVDALARRIPLVSDRPTIIFGADVTHPHPGEDSSPSIAAVSVHYSDKERPENLFFFLVEVSLSFSSPCISLPRWLLLKTGRRSPSMQD